MTKAKPKNNRKKTTQGTKKSSTHPSRGALPQSSHLLKSDDNPPVAANVPGNGPETTLAPTAPFETSFKTFPPERPQPQIQPQQFAVSARTGNATTSATAPTRTDNMEIVMETGTGSPPQRITVPGAAGRTAKPHLLAGTTTPPAIHPLFSSAAWHFNPTTFHQTFRPSFVLATNLLATDAILTWWINRAMTNRAARLGMPLWMYVMNAGGCVGAEHMARVRAALEGLVGRVRFSWKKREGDSGDIGRGDAVAGSTPPEELAAGLEEFSSVFDDTGVDTQQQTQQQQEPIHITLSPQFLDFALDPTISFAIQTQSQSKNQTQQQKQSTDLLRRMQFMLAITLKNHVADIICELLPGPKLGFRDQLNDANANNIPGVSEQRESIRRAWEVYIFGTDGLDSLYSSFARAQEQHQHQQTELSSSTPAHPPSLPVLLAHLPQVQEPVSITWLNQWFDDNTWEKMRRAGERKELEASMRGRAGVVLPRVKMGKGEGKSGGKKGGGVKKTKKDKKKSGGKKRKDGAKGK
ncbi:hypothetical protein K402DRAFT_452737 [Aulographum hederae CBS 113979]|uniref:Uncharacterized protein n=1 Tax=Aulographum hederae CBS 113979 TaxID=1176131 RepID=A0A6G1H671_9PEZI|nr:hypothetical protein K402DRAFT_452737 [Aulographum hederae CBS 113979]